MPADLQKMMQDLGPLQDIRFVRVDPMGADEYDVTFAKGEFIWILALNAQGKVVITFFHPK